MPADDSQPRSQEARDAWWAAREDAYRQRPDIQQETEELRAEARQRAQENDDAAARLEKLIADGVPGAQEALNREMTQQAIEDDPPEPSAMDDPDEWRAYFRWMHGRDLPLRAEYEAERHRIDQAAPPDVGGLAAEYYERNYPRSADPEELEAEWEGVTAEEIRRRRESPWSGSQQDQDLTAGPEPDGQAPRLLAAEIAEYEDLVSNREYVARARAARDEAIDRFGMDPDEADAQYLADLEAESYPDRFEAWMEAGDPEDEPDDWRGAGDPEDERALAAGWADDDAQADDQGLYRQLTHAVAAVTGHDAASAEDARSRAPDGDFADIWAAFTRLRDSLDLPGGAEAAGQVSSGPVSAALLEDAMTGARASAAWYSDTPEWQRITLVTSAARALLDTIRAAAGSYWNEISRDIRVRGFIRTVAARTCHAVSASAGALAGKLERSSGPQTRAWRDLTRLQRTAGAAASRIIGYQPPLSEAEQIIDGLSQQRQAAARTTEPGSPASLAALSFPAPLAPVTTAAPEAAGRRAITGTIRRPVGPQH
jgi:hypothetical protein